jgi:hypothetical protein
MAVATKQIQKEPSSNSVAHPYDLPKSITFSFNPATKFLSLQFDYIVDEPIKEIKIASDGKFQAGKNSLRIFCLGIPTNGLDTLDHIPYSLLELLRKGTSVVQETTPYSQTPFDNYQILRQLVEEYSPSIIEFIRRIETYDVCA